MLIFRGWGSVAALLVAGLVGMGMESIGFGRPVAYSLGGLACVAVGLWVNHLRHHGAGGHALFWIPIEYWGVAIVIGALAGL